jgi:hypothetical protein
MLIYNGHIYCASVGDSRAIIGSISHSATGPVDRKKGYIPGLQVISARRKSNPVIPLYSIPITKD